MLPDEVRKAVEDVDQIFDDADNGEWATIKAHLLARDAEVERLQARVEREESDCLEVIQERDWAQDCLQKAHIALGGDGEWTCKMPSPEPPDSGDLHYDVPALAEEVRARAERAEALLRDASRYLDPRHYSEISARITAHLSENSRVRT